MALQQPKIAKNIFFMFAIVLMAVTVAGCGTPAAQDTTSAQSETTNPAPTGTTTAASFKDGTYTAEGDYRSPAGAESITVTVTLKDNVITDANVVSNATVPTSKRMQAAFISGYKTEVVGKNIADIHLSKVSGSSLTPMGFNDALTKIEAQAQ